MSIRWKLLILLLAISLVPLVIMGVLGRRGTLHMGRELADEARQTLIDLAGQYMRQVIQGQSALLAARREVAERDLRSQARAVERCLADPQRRGPINSCCTGSPTWRPASICPTTWRRRRATSDLSTANPGRWLSA